VAAGARFGGTISPTSKTSQAIFICKRTYTSNKTDTQWLNINQYWLQSQSKEEKKEEILGNHTV